MANKSGPQFTAEIFQGSRAERGFVDRSVLLGRRGYFEPPVPLSVKGAVPDGMEISLPRQTVFLPVATAKVTNVTANRVYVEAVRVFVANPNFRGVGPSLLKGREPNVYVDPASIISYDPTPEFLETAQGIVRGLLASIDEVTKTLYAAAAPLMQTAAAEYAQRSKSAHDQVAELGGVGQGHDAADEVEAADGMAP
jgi:hypothetical protein